MHKPDVDSSLRQGFDKTMKMAETIELEAANSI